MKHYPLIFVILLLAINSHADTYNVKTSSDKSQNSLAPEIKRTAVTGEFADVKAFLISAIEERGIKISTILHIGDMLQRTGEAVGDNTPIYKQAEAIEFCSATLSREMMQADPHNIVFCPFSILIYELADSPGTTYLAYRRPFYHVDGKNDSSQSAIDALLSGIIDDAAK